MDATDVAARCDHPSVVAAPIPPMRLHSCRSVIGAVVAGLAASALLVPATACAAPCDGPSCVEHLRTDAVEGAECQAARLYPFGLDANGSTFICYATYRNPTTATWVRMPNLVGVRDFGALCDGGGVAQSLDGIPMVCRDGIWDRYTPALPVT